MVLITPPGNPMNKEDAVDVGISAGNPIGMRVSALKEMRDGGAVRPCVCVCIEGRERERGFIYVSTPKPMPMRVSQGDGAHLRIYANQ